MGQHVTAVGQQLVKKELKKHAATIHCSNTLTLLQRKITNALLYHAYNDLMKHTEHDITVKQLCRLIGYQGHNHAAIKEALKGLISTVIEWNLIDDETGAENWTASSILASVSLEGPLCYYAYSPRMKQLMHSPSMFGKIDLVIQSKFRSSYGLALYENCIRYRGLPHTKWFDMDLFKKLMGVPSGKYDIFRDLKRRVLDKAIDEVNTYSDLVIMPDYLREGRKVVNVRFKLKDRAKKLRLGLKKSNALLLVEDPLKEKLLKQFALTENQMAQLFFEYDVAFIHEKIALIESSKAYQEGKVYNLAGYLMSAIKNNYQKPKLKEVNGSSDFEWDLELSELKRDAKSIQNAYALYRENVIEDAINALSKKDRGYLLKRFNRLAAPTIKTVLQLQRNRYNAETVLHAPIVKAQLRQFALRELDFISLISLEEFVAQSDDSKRASWQKLKSFDPDHPLLRAPEYQ